MAYQYIFIFSPLNDESIISYSTFAVFLKIYLEEKSQEADTLTSRIQELEMQLRNEKDECKR